MMTTTASDLNTGDALGTANAPGAFPQPSKELRLPSPPAVETPSASEESGEKPMPSAEAAVAPSAPAEEQTDMVVDEVAPIAVAAAPVVPDITAATMTPAISPTVEEAPKDTPVTPAVPAEAPKPQDTPAVTEPEDTLMENAAPVAMNGTPQEETVTTEATPAALPSAEMPTQQQAAPIDTSSSLMGASPFMAPPPAPVAGEPVISSTASLPTVTESVPAVAGIAVTPSALVTPSPMPPSTPAPASAYTSSFATPNMLSTPFVPPSQSETPMDAEKYATALLQDQLRFCMNLTRAIKKRKDAFPFGAPVDPVLLNIPTYFDVIEKPMDISTVEKKLQTGVYTAVDEYKQDFLLIFANCYKFNGEEAPVSLMGKSLEKHFLKEMEKLPMEPREKKKKPSRPAGTPATHETHVSRPKREVPSTPRESPLLEQQARTAVRKQSAQLKFAGALLRELMKKQYAPYNLAFLQPVDPIALGIPQYRDIIRHPMDLSTMKKKLDNGNYRDEIDFERDMRLMFNNCYTFNAPGSEVYNLGKELEAVFERKWEEKPGPGGEYSGSMHGDEKPRRTSAPAYSYEDADDESTDDDDQDVQHIEMLKTQVQLLTTQLTLLTEKRARKKKAKAAAQAAAAMEAQKQAKKPKQPRPKQPTPGGSSSGFPKPPKQPRATKKRAFTDLDPDKIEELTYDQKRELSENINILTQEQLSRVLQIIRENTHIDESQGEEIELDIDSLDRKTLWKLYTYVTKHTRKAKRAKMMDGKAGRGGDSSSSGSSSGSDSDDSSDSN